MSISMSASCAAPRRQGPHVPRHRPGLEVHPGLRRGRLYVELHPAATMLAGAAFLRSVIAAFPYKLHTILTDNGTHFADQPRYRSGPTARYRLDQRPHTLYRQSAPSHPGTTYLASSVGTPSAAVATGFVIPCGLGFSRSRPITSRITLRLAKGLHICPIGLRDIATGPRSKPHRQR